MTINENPFLTILRNKKTSIRNFRHAADRLSHCLAQQVYSNAEKKELSINTPLNKATGYVLKNSTVIIPILRSGLTMLHPFLHYFDEATIGVMGLRRDEQTKQTISYYTNLPDLHDNDDVIIIDPMLATGGTAITATEAIINSGHPEHKITFCGIVCSLEGVTLYKKKFPKVKTVIAATDQELNTNKFIIPGLGDFGDRYFGTG